MFKIVGCVLTQHDLRLVLVAAVICLFACAAFTHMLARMRAAFADVPEEQLIEDVARIVERDRELHREKASEPASA